MSISIKNLTYIYNPGTAFEKKALNNISLEIENGEFIGLIGQTGSGKSTLIQHLNALIAPTEGEIFFNGENIHADKAGLKSIRTKIGLVFQYPEHQLFEATVYKDCAFGPSNMGLTEEEIDIRVKKALETVGIGSELYEKSPFELSGGQKRRLAIAGVLAMEPEVLILDEPTAGLDPKGRDDILFEIQKMHRQLGLTIILVSHNMEDIASLTDRIIVMHNGSVVRTGTACEIFSDTDLLENIGLAAPKLTQLFNELSKRGVAVPRNIFTVEDAVSHLKNLLLNKHKTQENP